MSKTFFNEVAGGPVYLSPEGVEEVAINPRSAVLPNGHIVCSFMLQSGFGINDFKPQIVFSTDGGHGWTKPRLIWPHLVNRLSCIGQISVIPGTCSLLFYGAAFPVDTPGEIYWREDIRGLKQNSLMWARSDDGGQIWSDPQLVALPHPGSAEVQGPILVARDGSWLACYAPYRSWDSTAEFELNCLMQLRSMDEGTSWSFNRIMTFAESGSGAAEAWMAECGEALLASCWHTNLAETGGDFSNKLAVSWDGGQTWEGPLDTAIQGQSTALLTLDTERVLLVYNQRKHGEPGIRGAIFSCADNEVKITSDEMLWAAPQATRGQSSGDHADWTDFAFGEPAMVRLDHKKFLLVFWEKGTNNGISVRVFEAAL